MKTEAITIIGLRRTGLAIASALKKSSPSLTVIGHDSHRERVDQTSSLETFDRTEPNLIKAVEPADIIVLVMPALELEGTLNLIAGSLKPHTLIIDLTALKENGYRRPINTSSKGFILVLSQYFRSIAWVMIRTQKRKQLQQICFAIVFFVSCLLQRRIQWLWKRP